jgi:hypothetical protein
MAFARLDKTRGYVPGNCTWMTKSEASKLNAAYMKAAGLLTGRRRKNEKCKEARNLEIEVEDDLREYPQLAQ